MLHPIQYAATSTVSCNSIRISLWSPGAEALFKCNERNILSWVKVRVPSLHHMTSVPQTHRSKSLRWCVVILRWTPALLWSLRHSCETILVYNYMTTRTDILWCQILQILTSSNVSCVVLQVTWTAPLIPNGEIERYEIRMPDPHISHTNTSILNCTVSSLLPYTNYSITILACSGGGGHAGGCTESLPTLVTTLPTIPQGLPSLSVVAISESFLAVSWQFPSRPNGPNIR